ncbi:MAG: hypothetical protein HYV36_01915 [Lentisphaerae bacterium]|nr:hypothetical protein [Lentisphaerota bacterium]
MQHNLPPIEHTITYGAVTFIVRKIRRSRIHEAVVEKRSQIQPPVMPG